MNGKKPNKEEKKWLDAITEHGCCVCKNEFGLFTPCEIHHISGKNNHLETIGLCFHHHRDGKDCRSYTSRHPYRYRFEERYGTEQELLDKLKGLIND